VFDEASGQAVRAIGGPRACLGIAEKVAVTPNGELYVLSHLTTAVPDSPRTAVTVFEPGASGDVRPLRRIPLAPSPGGITGLELDSHRNVYVSGAAIQVFSPGAGSRSTPIRAIAGEKTQLGQPNDIAFDSRGEIYVAIWASRADHRGEVAVYDRDARGNVEPRRVIRLVGDNGSFYPKRLAIGPGDTLFVLSTFTHACFIDRQLGRVMVYPPYASGKVEPVRTLPIKWQGAEAAQDSVDAPEGIAVDERGYLYVSVAGPNAVLVYAPGASGQARPIRTMRWPGYVPPEYSSDYSWRRTLARDGKGMLYVTNKRVNGPAGCA
jgi:sugar lactone lactonase YvrE